MVMHQTESKLTAGQIAGQVEAACNKYSLALLQTYIYHEIVESKGFPIQRKVFVYNICQAKNSINDAHHKSRVFDIYALYLGSV